MFNFKIIYILFIYYIVHISHNLSNILDLYKQLKWELINPSIISQSLKMRKLRSNAELRKYLESKINPNMMPISCIN